MLSRVLDGLSTFADTFYAKQFGSKERIQFYESLCALIENGVGIDQALDEVRAIYSDNGKRPRHPVALASAGMVQGVRNGKPLAEACQKWMPYQEAAIIGAGERSGALVQAFLDCVRMIEARSQIGSLVVSTTLYPSFIWALMAYLLHVVATRMVPAMTRASNPDSWTGAPRVLYLLATFVQDWGTLTLITLVALLIIILATLPYFTGPLRVKLEDMPPWSIYKALHGSTFLLNISVMLKANINQVEALESLLQGAKPWLRERLIAAIYGVRMGKNFGEALRLAGHGFPDKTAVQFLCVLATRKGFSEAIHRFSIRWLEQSLKIVGRYSKSLLTLSAIAMGSLMILVLLGTYGMQEAVTSNVHR